MLTELKAGFGTCTCLGVLTRVDVSLKINHWITQNKAKRDFMINFLVIITARPLTMCSNDHYA